MVPKVPRLRGSSETHNQGRILPTQLLRTSRGRPRGALSGLRHQDELVQREVLEPSLREQVDQRVSNDLVARQRRRCERPIMTESAHRRAVALCPENPDLLCGLGVQLKASSRKHAEAKEVLQRAVPST